MNANQMIKNIKTYQKTINSEFENMNKVISQINLKKYKDEDVQAEIKKYNKYVANYKKAISGLNTNFKFLKAQHVMSLEETMEIENELKGYKQRFKEITKYANI